MNQVNLLLDTPLGWYEVYGSMEYIHGARWVLNDDAVVGSGLRSVTWKQDAEEQVKAYFAGERHTLALPVQWNTSEGQERTFQALQEVKCGEVMSVEEFIADKRLHDVRKSDLLYAIAANPFALIVPSHRIELNDNTEAESPAQRIFTQLRAHEMGVLEKVG